MRNIDIVNLICEELDRLGQTHDAKKLITYVTDCKDHDMRYAIDSTKIHESWVGCRRPSL